VFAAILSNDCSENVVVLVGR